MFCNSNNIRTFASRLLSNCTKSFILSRLLLHVSAAGISEEYFDLLIN